MKLSKEQIKGKIKNEAFKYNADPRTLIRIYMMERFLERLSFSEYKDNFIIKGGVLISQMVGYKLRSTMDIDTSVKNVRLDILNIKNIIQEIIDINLDDDIRFVINNVENIMDSMEYPGLRVHIDSIIDNMIVPIKIDISTGDKITPSEIEYNFKLLLEDKYISLKTYNIETILAEKFQTIIFRNITNTRMRDFYYIYILLTLYKENINLSMFSKAYYETSKIRESINLIGKENEILDYIDNNLDLRKFWAKYQDKYEYAKGISFDDLVALLKSISQIISSNL